MSLQVLALGEILRHEVAENLVRMPARLPDVISGGLEDLGVRKGMRHDSMLQLAFLIWQGSMREEQSSYRSTGIEEVQ